MTKKSIGRRIYEAICKGISGKRVLYVGVASYSEDLKILSNNNNQLISIDKEIKEAIHGAREHYTSNVTSALKFPNNYFDIIIMFGVYDFGLNDEKELLKSFVELRRILKIDGKMFVDLTKKDEKNE